MKEHEVLMRLDAKLAMILTKIRPDYVPFLDKDGTLVVQLDKALYGCVESARLWYDHLRNTLISMLTTYASSTKVPWRTGTSARSSYTSTT
jgi:hypothetical protein